MVACMFRRKLSLVVYEDIKLTKTDNFSTKEMGMEMSLHLESVRAVNALKMACWL